MFWKSTRWSFLVAIFALICAGIYGGLGATSTSQWFSLAGGAAWLCLVLGIMEVSLSFDNAVLNATILQRMNPFWQKMFLTVGILIAVVGMRLIFPIMIVMITAKLSITEVFTLAFEKGDPNIPGTYGYLLSAAHPMIASFGGMFLLLMFLNFVFEDRDIKWLRPLEEFLAKMGKIDMLSVAIAFGALVTAASFAPEEERTIILIAGTLGAILHIVVGGVSDYMEKRTEQKLSGNIAKASLGLFLYLELLDASLSFDGAIGAFAITADIFLIALGLGLIGSMFVRSLTVYFVRANTLKEFVHLEHGAHWAIGALATILLVSINVEVSEIITGLIGVTFIGAAFFTSWRYKQRLELEESNGEHEENTTSPEFIAAK